MARQDCVVLMAMHQCPVDTAPRAAGAYRWSISDGARLATGSTWACAVLRMPELTHDDPEP
jgi:hypothetical protein